MRLEFYCVMCGKEKQVTLAQRKNNIDLIEVVKQVDWITQQNGEHFDIYCSEACAK